jgi:nicotinic acid phosphoribosyltransferase
MVFSDGLDVGTCCQLRQFCESNGLREIYGIGTHLTNGKSACEKKKEKKKLNQTKPNEIKSSKRYFHYFEYRTLMANSLLCLYSPLVVTRFSQGRF